MSRIVALVLFVSGSMLTGCSATSRYMQPRPGVALGAASNNLAQVVFVRPSSFAKGVAVTIIDEQGNYIGDSTPNSHFAVQLPAGEHTFISWGEGTHSMKATLAAGKTYYVEVAPAMGMWSARFHLKAVKPSVATWKNLQTWIAETTLLEVMRDQGQKEIVEARRAKANETVQKGVSRFAEYNAQEVDERTLAPSDGV